MRTPLPLAALAVALFAADAGAQTSYPMLTHVTPVAVQRGRTSEVTVFGQMDLSGAYQALFEGGGLSAEVVPPKPGTKGPVRAVRLKVTAAADAAPGAREFRLVSNLGVSSVGQLVVSEHPVVEEKGDNNTREKANEVPVPCVACGRLEAAEDVDHFKFKAKAGQTLTFEVLCARLQDKIHDLQKHADPMLTLYDAEGRELAANDDFYFADPLLAHTFARDGDYFVQVRDSKYDGDARWVYALLVTDRPYASHVFPMAGNPGATVTVEPVGSAALARPRVALKVPEKLGLQEVVLDLGDGKATNPVPFLVSDLPQVLEVEPNDAPAQATRVSVPCGINGRIGAPRDLDHYVFAAKKGKAIRFEVKARRFGTRLLSTLDSVIDVMTPKGAVLASNDDAFGKDSALVFTPPADGDYVLRVRDLNSKGSPTAVYYVECDWAKPDFTVRVDGDKAMVGPGGRTAWFVSVARVNGFAGPVKIDVKGLPQGVTVNPLTIPPSMTQGVLVLSAAAAAPRGAANVEVTGTAALSFDGKEEAAVRPATPTQEIYFPGGGRGLFDVRLQTVAVVDPGDVLEVQVSAAEVVLKPGGEARLEVTVRRKPGFDKGVSLDVLLRHLGRVYGSPLPPGVTLVEGKSKTLLGGASKGHVVLRAAADAAPVEGVPLCVLAHVSVNFVVKMSYASAPVRLSVRK
jgi:hypothetical protein